MGAWSRKALRSGIKDTTFAGHQHVALAIWDSTPEMSEPTIFASSTRSSLPQDRYEKDSSRWTAPRPFCTASPFLRVKSLNYLSHILARSGNRRGCG